MPRNHHSGASSLRNRIRITNKTRLKIHQGNLEADALLIPDEDEEKHHLTNLVAGVDAEDAQEHHLQAVLSASQRTQTHVKPTTAGEKAQNAQPAAYIPTPDSTGIVDNYAELYPSDRWKDPSSYLCSSSTVEELCQDGLAEGFTYYMDERDKEWLDKNNQEARGEGTSAQGAVSSSSTRTSARSAKAKGKEPEASQPLIISDTEFELVMGLFEKITHEKTEYLHHGLENGMAFPAFTEYQETFSSPLVEPTFANFVVPSWIPPPAQLVRIARTVYPYWKERRLERGGHRIIPILNFDENDTLNESYVCFRRREIKAVRKTRASQATSSDKLLRLQQELSYTLDLAKAILQRENQRQEIFQHGQQIWERRIEFANLKRKYPTLNDRGDEELLIDKEKPRKTENPNRSTKLRTESGPAPRLEVVMRPKERLAFITQKVEDVLNRQKDQDHHWEDHVDNPYQPSYVPYPGRLFKYVPVNFTAAESDGKPVSQRSSRALRLRRGRGGRMLVDRRNPSPHPSKRPKLFNSDDSDDQISLAVAERWRFDGDDVPAVGPDGPEEHNRMLVDDYSPKYLRHSMTFLTDIDQQNLVTDPSIPIVIDGRPHSVVPFRLGMPPQAIRRDGVRPMPPPQGLQPPGPLPAPIPINATPVSVQQQIKKMPQQPVAPPLQMRISSNGGMRPASALGINATASQSSPPASTTAPQHPATNGINRAAINISHVDMTKPDGMTGYPAVNGIVQVQVAEVPPSQGVKANGVNGSPVKPGAPQSGLSLAGYNFGLAGQNPSAAALAQLAMQQNALSQQQMNNLKTVLAQSGHPQGYLVSGNPNFNMQQLANNANMNIKLPAARHMPQWVAANTKAPNGVVNGVDGSLAQAAPPRAPSANGTRPNGIRVPSNGQLNSMSPHVANHSPSPILSANASLTQAQSPPRISITPTLTKASPSLQHSQPSNSKSGY